MHCRLCRANSEKPAYAKRWRGISDHLKRLSPWIPYRCFRPYARRAFYPSVWILYPRRLHVPSAHEFCEPLHDGIQAGPIVPVSAPRLHPGPARSGAAPVAILIDRWSIQSYVGLDFSWKPLTWRDFLPALRFRRAIPRPRCAPCRLASGIFAAAPALALFRVERRGGQARFLSDGAGGPMLFAPAH